MTKSEALKKTNIALEQKIKELRAEEFEENEQTEPKKLIDYFSDKEYNKELIVKLIYLKEKLFINVELKKITNYSIKHLII